MTEKQTHFGYQQVPWTQKTQKVTEVFHSVANNYDIMNDVMSLGIHRLWKRFAISMCAIKPGQTILDLAGGTGDLTALIHKKLRNEGSIHLTDINNSMLISGRDKLIDEGHCDNIHYTQANAESLPYPDNKFDTVIIGFGLRNVTDKQAALDEMYRILKPGGSRAIILEFSKPAHEWLNKLYDTYSFSLLPKLGKWIAKDEQSYQYLAESIRMHPCQETLKSMMEQSQFEQCTYQNLTGGIVAVHKGYKI